MKLNKRDRNNIKVYLISYSFTTKLGESGDGSCMWYSINLHPQRVTEITENIKLRNNFKNIAITNIVMLTN